MTPQATTGPNVNGAKRIYAAPFTGIFRRAFFVAIVLGSALTALNQSGAIFGDQAIQYSQMALVYIIPFAVVSVSQYLGIRQALADAGRQKHSGVETEHPIATAICHGIPVRAAIVSLIAGSLAAGFTLLFTNGGGSGISDLSLAPTIQGFILPALFGLLSQTIAYRRVLRVTM